MRQGSAGVCLADACEALHCDALAALAPGWAHSPADPYARHAPCRASTAAAHRRMCEVGKDRKTLNPAPVQPQTQTRVMRPAARRLLPRTGACAR